MTDPGEIVGVRFEPRGPLGWYRAGAVEAPPGSWVVVELDGRELLGQVIVGRGQCLEFRDAPADLPDLLRPARPDEIPGAARTAGQELLDSLP